MSRINLLIVLTVLLLGSTLLSAQASRTWVSGVGDDANPCSRTAPCKTFAGAISKTAVGGEIDALDPGGFGAVTITKAITLDGGGGQVASTLVSGTNGIVVQANAQTDVVIIRNLRINGIGSGINGIQFNSGKDLNVENCYIFGFTQNGINVTLNQAFAASVHVLNSVIKNNSGVGIRAANASTPVVQVGIDRTSVILDNIGIEAAQHSRVVVTRSFVENASADGVKADDAVSSDAQISVSNSDLSFNNNGANGAPGGSVNVAFNSIAYNTTCGLDNSGGSVASFGNNRIVNANCGTITFGVPQT